MLFLLFSAGIRLEFIALILIMYLAIWIFRGRAKKSIEHRLHLHVPNFKNWPGWAKSVMTFAILIAILIVLKEMVYFGLSVFGIELKAMLEASIMQMAK
jgi:hypothetical protein